MSRPPSSRPRRADAVLGAVAVVLGVAVWLWARQIPAAGGSGLLSSRFLPQAIAVAFVALGLALVARPGGQTVDAVGRRLGEPRLLLMAAAIAIYFLSFRVVDFRVGTFVFMAVAMALMGSRRWLEIVVVAALASVGTYLVFRYGFTVLLPTWN